MSYYPAVLRGMKVKVDETFTKIREEIEEFWTHNDINEYVDNDDSNEYKFEDMELSLDFEVKGKKMYVYCANDDTAGACIEFKTPYIFEFDEDMCKDDYDPYYFSEEKKYEWYSWDIIYETLKSICTCIEYNDEKVSLETIKKVYDDKFELACIISKIGINAFELQVPYINGKNVMKYI